LVIPTGKFGEELVPVPLQPDRENSQSALERTTT